MAEDDYSILQFDGEHEEHYADEAEEVAHSPGFLETYPKIGRAYGWFLGAMDTIWSIAAVFQPLFKHSWVFVIIYFGITNNRRLQWKDLVPVLQPPAMEEEDDLIWIQSAFSFFRA